MHTQTLTAANIPFIDITTGPRIRRMAGIDRISRLGLGRAASIVLAVLLVCARAAGAFQLPSASRSTTSTPWWRRGPLRIHAQLEAR